MKKTRNLLIILLCIFTVVSFSGCGKDKSAISADSFCSKMENKGYIITDSTSQYSTSDEIEESYIASSEDYEYQIEFIVLDDSSDAKGMYNHNKSIFEKEKENSVSKFYTDVSMANYSKYTNCVNGKYKVLSRIENTLIYINADLEYKDEIDSVLKSLGY